MSPTISVIVPVYNVEQYLHKCVDSIINQTYTHLEIILVDDGSPDNCGLICDDYAKKDSRVKVIHKKNNGVSSARNAGLEVATGDFVGFVDSDDWIHEKMYETLVTQALSHHSDLTNCMLIESNKTIGELPQDEHNSIVIDQKELLYNYIKHGFYVMRNLYSKEFIKDFRFDENIRFVEDIFFGLKVIESTKNCVFINYPYYIYNLGNDSSLTRVNYNNNTFMSLKANTYMQKKATFLFPNDRDLQAFIRERIIGNCLYHLHHLHLKGNAHLDNARAMKKESKQTYNDNFVFFKNPSVFKTIIRVLNTSQLSYFYRFYFAMKKNRFVKMIKKIC